MKTASLPPFTPSPLLLCVGALLLAAGGTLFARLAAAPPPEVEIAGYATSLQGRTASQRYNARKAVEALNGEVIAPGAVFSFNQVVRSWTLDQGYVKAPVSYEGDLVRAYGGGVCQASTTLYNAALLAGLPIVERHPHVFAPHYVPPGRDAAVAQKTIDLRFKNPYSWPLRIRSAVRGDSLDIRLFGAARPETTAQVTSEMLDTTHPQHLTRVVSRPGGTTGRAYVRSPGLMGCRVVTDRVFSQASRELRRERLADNTYQAMDHVVQVTEEEPR